MSTRALIPACAALIAFQVIAQAPHVAFAAQFDKVGDQPPGATIGRFWGAGADEAAAACNDERSDDSGDGPGDS